MELKQALETLDKLETQMRAYNYALSLSNWDISTLAPPKGKGSASKSVGYLSGVLFQIKQSKEMGEVLETLLKHGDDIPADAKRKAEVYQREINKTKKIPREDYQAYTELKSKSQIVWQEAKNKSDYQMFSPYLKDMIAYKKQFAKLAGDYAHPYDPCLDDYEQDFTVADAERFFSAVREKTVPLSKKIGTEGKKLRDDFLYRSYPVETQRKVSYELLECVGFDLESGVMSTSEHPFTTNISTGDVRLTTHFYENYLTAALMSTVHEAGHGIHGQNGQISPLVGDGVLSRSPSSGISESQSRFYENIVCRSLPFWEFFYPTLQGFYPEQLKDVTMQELHEAINLSKPSFIRIEADELTYNLHILIRYELEKMMFEDAVDVNKLPALWNGKYEEYLNVVPANDKTGILQDVHWSGGMFGYFPSYSLGNAYAAQFKYAMEKELDIAELSRKGDIAPITQWLNKNIHQYGLLKTPAQIVKDATGEALNPKYLTDYLEEKFSSIYF